MPQGDTFRLEISREALYRVGKLGDFIILQTEKVIGATYDFNAP